MSQPLPESLQHLQQSAAAAERSQVGNQERAEASLEEGSPLGDSHLEEEHSSEAGWETASDEADGKEHVAAAESNAASTAPGSKSATEEQSQSRLSQVRSTVVPDHTLYLVTAAPQSSTVSFEDGKAGSASVSVCYAHIMQHKWGA